VLKNCKNITEVTQDEIVACAHIADVLLKYHQNDLAFSVIDAIHKVISLNQVRVISKKELQRGKPELVLVTNGKC
jgi:hypothetical protein